MKIIRWTGKNTVYKFKRYGGVFMQFKSLNVNALKDKKTTIISSEKSVKNITPINWNEDVATGKRKIIVGNK